MNPLQVSFGEGIHTEDVQECTEHDPSKGNNVRRSPLSEINCLHQKQRRTTSLRNVPTAIQRCFGNIGDQKSMDPEYSQHGGYVSKV